MGQQLNTSFQLSELRSQNTALHSQVNKLDTTNGLGY